MFVDANLVQVLLLVNPIEHYLTVSKKTYLRTITKSVESSYFATLLLKAFTVLALVASMGKTSTPSPSNTAVT